MRITGGEFAGRRVQVFGRGVRPTTDRTREALFSIVADRVRGARFLDLFAGSGAVGLDAWSRGAERVCWVESDRRVAGVLRQNAAGLGADAAAVIVSDALVQLKKGFAGERFDMIFADPPYEWGREAGRPGAPWRGHARTRGSCALLAELIRAHGRLKREGLLILERRATGAEEVLSGWRLVDRREYGESRLLFFCEEDIVP